MGHENKPSCWHRDPSACKCAEKKVIADLRAEIQRKDEAWKREERFWSDWNTELRAAVTEAREHFLTNLEHGDDPEDVRLAALLGAALSQPAAPATECEHKFLPCYPGGDWKQCPHCGLTKEIPAPAKKEEPCDGNHATPACADKQCWNRVPVAEKASPKPCEECGGTRNKRRIGCRGRVSGNCAASSVDPRICRFCFTPFDRCPRCAPPPSKEAA